MNKIHLAVFAAAALYCASTTAHEVRSSSYAEEVPNELAKWLRTETTWIHLTQRGATKEEVAKAVKHCKVLDELMRLSNPPQIIVLVETRTCPQVAKKYGPKPVEEPPVVILNNMNQTQSRNYNCNSAANEVSSDFGSN